MGGYLLDSRKERQHGYEFYLFGRNGISDGCPDGWTLSDRYRCHVPSTNHAVESRFCNGTVLVDVFSCGG